MIVDIEWQPKGYNYRKAICDKYGLPYWWTINKKTYNVTITQQIREALRLGESNGLFIVYNIRDNENTDTTDKKA